jgi:peptidoglycan/LPS O-acetylase OafA/YrhL
MAGPRPVPWPRFIGEFFFIQNYYNSFWGPTWSLAVEEHFYLALPLLLLLRNVRKLHLHVPKAVRKERPVVEAHVESEEPELVGALH